ncbi:MAG TPA: hypothetical protein PK467_20290 [Candidatus Wallbacteria bacterium]|nr:hypothetical protein [Candidatus Wallbacteria bacterium]
MQINNRNITITSLNNENENLTSNARVRKQDVSGDNGRKSELMALLQSVMKKPQVNVNTAKADQMQGTAGSGVLPDVNTDTGNYSRNQIITQNGVSPIGQSKPQQSLLMLGGNLDVKG